MMIADRRAEQVRASWQQLRPLADSVSELFFRKLLTLDPTLAPLFQNSPAHRHHFVTLLDQIIAELDQRGVVLIMHDLGRQQVKHGLDDEQHEKMGTALLWALGETLGEAFTPQVKEAWLESFIHLSQLAVVAKSHATQQGLAA